MRLFLARSLALCAVLLAACTDSPPTGTSQDISTGVWANNPPNPCTNCVSGPTAYGRGLTVDSITAAPGSYTFNLQNDIVTGTDSRVVLNGVTIVDFGDNVGPGAALSFNVTLLGVNNMMVSVRGAKRDSRVGIWIAGTPPPNPIDVQPNQAQKLPGGTQQFAVVSGEAGPYTWSVNGTDGGDATYGMIDASGFYTAPSAVPTPATFPVCARVTANPSNTDCSPVTINPIPTAGEDVVVYNDINMLDDVSLTDPNNVTMFHNLLTYTASGPRATGTEVLIDGAHGPICGAAFCGGSFSAFAAQVVTEGFTMTIQTSGDLSTIGSNVKVLFLWLPTIFYTVPEFNAMKMFASEGGRIVFIGEHASFYGGGFPAQNDFLLNMGAQMTNVGNLINCGYNTLPFASLRAHQITTGMNQVTMACSSQILLGPNDFALYYDSSNTLVLSGVAKIDLLPLPAPPISSAIRSGIPSGWKPTADAQGKPLQ